MCLRYLLQNRREKMPYNGFLKDICSAANGFEGNRFVGIKYIDGVPEIHFPIGYNISNDKNGIQKDIILLIRTLKYFLYKNGHDTREDFKNPQKAFPLFAYQRMVLRYLNYGDYSEIENYYDKGVSGKINWSRTIKNCSPVFDNSGTVYLDYIVRTTRVKDDTLTAGIYDYCVSRSFEFIGWLYTDKKFSKSCIQFNKKLFLSVVKEKLSKTNSDRHKELFADMLVIIKDQDERGFKNNDFTYGTYEFEYIWEKLINSVYGVKNKQDYFPHSYWHINTMNGFKINHALEPDTIMVLNNNCFILDAKYYKYGSTSNPSHLPDTSSIQKQITYGEYLYKNDRFNFSKIYNVFLMPANLKNGCFKCDENYRYIGYADTDWKSGDNLFEKVAGVLIDTKYLMSNFFNKDKLVLELSKIICYNVN